MILNMQPTQEKEQPCKGLFFRVSKSHYHQPGKSISFKSEYRFLKRKSCSGCSSCGCLWDDLSEQEVIEAGEHGDIVELQMTNIGTDWETGYTDSWDLAFRVIKE